MARTIDCLNKLSQEFDTAPVYVVPQGLTMTYVPTEQVVDAVREAIPRELSKNLDVISEFLEVKESKASSPSQHNKEVFAKCYDGFPWEERHVLTQARKMIQFARTPKFFHQHFSPHMVELYNKCVKSHRAGESEDQFVIRLARVLLDYNVWLQGSTAGSRTKGIRFVTKRKTLQKNKIRRMILNLLE